MKKLICLLSTIVLLFSYACKKEEILGCTDPDSLTYVEDANMDDGTCLYIEDIFIGEWRVLNLFYNGKDWIRLGAFRNLVYEFKQNGDFRAIGQIHRGGIVSDWANFFNDGKWKVNFTELTLENGYPGLCDQNDHDFSYKLDENLEELELDVTCNNGDFIRIILERK